MIPELQIVVEELRFGAHWAGATKSMCPIWECARSNSLVVEKLEDFGVQIFLVVVVLRNTQ